MRQNLRKVNTGRDRVKQAFLAALAQAPHGPHGAAQAAQAAGVHRCTPYRWRAEDAAFAAAWAAVDDQRLAAHLAAFTRELAARQRQRRERLAELQPIYQQNAANARTAKDRYRW